MSTENPTPAAPYSSTSNGLGITALVLGIVALVGAFIPFLNYVSGLPALVGLVLGIVALFLKNKTKTLAIVGTILSGLALVLSVVMAIVYTMAFAGGINAELKKQAAEANEDVVVVYEVTGAAKNATITYATYNNGTAGTEQTSGQSLPWKKGLTVKAGGDFNFNSFTVNGANGINDTGDISCKITVDGEVVSQQTSSGPFANVLCSSSGFNKN